MATRAEIAMIIAAKSEVEGALKKVAAALCELAEAAEQVTQAGESAQAALKAERDR